MFDGNNSTSSKQHFLPGTTQVNYMIAIGATLVHILIHLIINIIAPNVRASCKHLRNIIFFQTQNIQTSRHLNPSSVTM
jgi:hypothetical protein